MVFSKKILGEVLRRLFRQSTVLKTAYGLREELTYIFNRMISKDKAEKEIGIWSGVVRFFGMNLFENFLSMLEKHIER